MHITIDIDGYLGKILDGLLDKGVCKTKSEAIRLGLLELNDKYSVVEEDFHFRRLQMKTMEKMWDEKDSVWEKYVK